MISLLKSNIRAPFNTFPLICLFCFRNFQLYPTIPINILLI